MQFSKPCPALLYEIHRVAVDVYGCLGNCFRISIVRVVNALKVFKSLSRPFSLVEHHRRVGVDRFYRTADVHDTQLLKLLQEAFLLSAQENEGIFRHFSYHCSAPPLLL